MLHLTLCRPTALIKLKQSLLPYTLLSFGVFAWWRRQMETFSVLLAICAGNSPVPGEFPAAQRPVTRSFDVFFDLHPNKRLSKQWWGWWFEVLSCPLWRHCNGFTTFCSSNAFSIVLCCSVDGFVGKICHTDSSSSSNSSNGNGSGGGGGGSGSGSGGGGSGSYSCSSISISISISSSSSSSSSISKCHHTTPHWGRPQGIASFTQALNIHVYVCIQTRYQSWKSDINPRYIKLNF